MFDPPEMDNLIITICGRSWDVFSRGFKVSLKTVFRCFAWWNRISDHAGPRCHDSDWICSMIKYIKWSIVHLFWQESYGMIPHICHKHQPVGVGKFPYITWIDPMGLGRSWDVFFKRDPQGELSATNTTLLHFRRAVDALKQMGPLLVISLSY